MKCIKEFLKPNWWKVGIIIVIGIFAIVFGYKIVCISGLCPAVLQVGSIYSYSKEIEGQCCSTVYSPWFWLGISNVKGAGWIIPFELPLIILYRFAGFHLITVLIYWYLLVCLIYFVFTKAKKMISKKPQPEEE